MIRCLLLGPEELKECLADENLVVIDLSIPQVYKEADVSGAIHFNCPHIVHRHDDVDCDEPSDNDLSEALPELDLLPGHIIVAYDAPHNPIACRRYVWILFLVENNSYDIVCAEVSWTIARHLIHWL